LIVIIAIQSIFGANLNFVFGVDFIAIGYRCPVCGIGYPIFKSMGFIGDRIPQKYTITIADPYCIRLKNIITDAIS
jgi:hypothetical protein